MLFPMSLLKRLLVQVAFLLAPVPPPLSFLNSLIMGAKASPWITAGASMVAAAATVTVVTLAAMGP